jgi:hypothetical protein
MQSSIHIPASTLLILVVVFLSHRLPHVSDWLHSLVVHFPNPDTTGWTVFKAQQDFRQVGAQGSTAASPQSSLAWQEFSSGGVGVEERPQWNISWAQTPSPSISTPLIATSIDAQESEESMVKASETYWTPLLVRCTSSTEGAPPASRSIFLTPAFARRGGDSKRI